MKNTRPVVKERRRHPRTRLEMNLRGIRMDPDGDLLEVMHMVDISKSGMGVFVNRAMYPGQRVLLSLPSVATGGRRSLYATVTRCRQRREEYHVGMEFEMGENNSWCDSENASIGSAAA
ncbi:MAG: PilZ domain-containing protein [Phycisphaerae bacterium]